MANPKFIMVGGFLGAGKTTTVSRLAGHYTGLGLKVGIVTNDQTDGLVDTHSLKAQGYAVGEVAGSCFCCNFHALERAVEELATDGMPDVILAEPVGSCTDLVATVVRPLVQKYRRPVNVRPYGVLLKPSHGLPILRRDKQTVFSPDAVYIFDKQLEEADFIAINRIDELAPPEVDELTRLIAARFPNRPIVRMSAKTGEGFDAFLQTIEGDRAVGKQIIDVDYDVYANGEAELGWLNGDVEVEAGQDFDLDGLLVDLVGDLRRTFGQMGAETAHLKVVGLADGAYGVANLVSGFTDVELSQPSKVRTRRSQLVVNARVALDPAKLESVVRDAIGRATSAVSAKGEVGTVKSFRPGRPVPTYRIAEAVGLAG